MQIENLSTNRLNKIGKKRAKNHKKESGKNEMHINEMDHVINSYSKILNLLCPDNNSAYENTMFRKVQISSQNKKSLAPISFDDPEIMSSKDSIIGEIPIRALTSMQKKACKVPRAGKITPRVVQNQISPDEAVLANTKAKELKSHRIKNPVPRATNPLPPIEIMKMENHDNEKSPREQKLQYLKKVYSLIEETFHSIKPAEILSFLQNQEKENQDLNQKLKQMTEENERLQKEFQKSQQDHSELADQYIFYLSEKKVIDSFQKRIQNIKNSNSFSFTPDSQESKLIKLISDVANKLNISNDEPESYIKYLHLIQSIKESLKNHKSQPKVIFPSSQTIPSLNIDQSQKKGDESLKLDVESIIKNEECDSFELPSETSSIPSLSLSNLNDFTPGTRSSRRAFLESGSVSSIDLIHSNDNINSEVEIIGSVIGHISVERFSSAFLKHQKNIEIQQENDPLDKNESEAIRKKINSLSYIELLNEVFEQYNSVSLYLHLSVLTPSEINELEPNFLHFLSLRDSYFDKLKVGFEDHYDDLTKILKSNLKTNEIATIWALRDFLLNTSASEHCQDLFNIVRNDFAEVQNSIPNILIPSQAVPLAAYAACFKVMSNISMNTRASILFLIGYNFQKIIPLFGKNLNNQLSIGCLVAIFEFAAIMPSFFYQQITVHSATSILHNFIHANFHYTSCIAASCQFFCSARPYLNQESIMWYTAIIFHYINSVICKSPFLPNKLISLLSAMTSIVTNRQIFSTEQLLRIHFLQFLISNFELESLIQSFKHIQDLSDQNDSIQPDTITALNPIKTTQMNDENHQNPPNKVPILQLSKLNLGSTLNPILQPVPREKYRDQKQVNNNNPINHSVQIVPSNFLPSFKSNKATRVSYLDLPKLNFKADNSSLNLDNPKLQLHFQPTAPLNLRVSISISLDQYSEDRTKFPIYCTTEVHVAFIQLLFSTLIDHSLHRFDVLFVDPFPTVNRKPNVLFSVMRHLEYPSNSNVVPQLSSVFTPRENTPSQEPLSPLPLQLLFSALPFQSHQSSGSKNNNDKNMDTFALPTLPLTFLPKLPSLSPERTENSQNSHMNGPLPMLALKDLKKSRETQSVLSFTISNAKSTPNFISSQVDQNLNENDPDSYVNTSINGGKKTTDKTIAEFLDYKRLLQLLVPSLFNPNKYSGGVHIASGAFGAVMLVECPDSKNGLVKKAVKILEKSHNEFDSPHLIEVYTEVSILEMCKNDRRVTQLLDYGCTTESYYIVMEFYPMTMKSWRKKLGNDLNNEDRLTILRLFKEFLNSATVLTEMKINHFDIKCDNVMLDCNGNPALADFGESMCYSGEKNSYTLLNKGTEWIKSPEMLSIALNSSVCNPNYDRRKNVGAGPPSDIWSIGCLFYELVTGEFLFIDSDWSRFFLRITDPKEELINKESRDRLPNDPRYLRFLEFVLQRTARTRPNLDQVITKFDEIFPEAVDGNLPHLSEIT